MRTFARYVSPLLAAMLLAACGLSPEEKRDRALTALEEHRFTDARLDLGSALQDRPDDPQLLLLLARTQLQLGDGEGALATLGRLQSAGRVPADFDLLRAEAELLRGDYDSALEIVDPLESAEAWRMAALAHLGLDEDEKAELAFAAGTKADGDRSRLFSDYALLRVGQGNLAQALELAERALATAPEGLDPLIANARVAQAARQPDRALEFYARAHAAWPESRAALLGRIGVLGDLGRLAEAKPLIGDAATRSPGDPAVIYLQARLVAEDGEWAKVREILQPLEDSEDIGHRQLYARALVELDLHEQAMARLTPMVRQVPRSAAIRRLLARAQLGSGDARAAMRTIEPLAADPAGTPTDYALYAEAARAAGDAQGGRALLAEVPPAERIARHMAEADAAMREGKWRSAIDSYEAVRQWTGDSNAMVLNNLAYARSRTGATRQAIELAEKAHTLVPDNASIKDTLGWLLWESKGDRTRGLALLREAAEMAPENTAIAEHLRRATRG